MAKASRTMLSVLALLIVYAPRLAVPTGNPICFAQFVHANWACAGVLHDEPQPADGPASGDMIYAALGSVLLGSASDENAVVTGPSPAELRVRRRVRGATGGVRFVVGGGGSDADKECCRSLKEVTDECVCDTLFRLPLFMTVAEHDYTLKVGNECNITFGCGQHGHRGEGDREK